MACLKNYYHGLPNNDGQVKWRKIATLQSRHHRESDQYATAYSDAVGFQSN